MLKQETSREQFSSVAQAEPKPSVNLQLDRTPRHQMLIPTVYMLQGMVVMLEELSCLKNVSRG